MTSKRVGHMASRHHGDVLMIEYVNGVPHNVVTTEGGYDFSKSKRWGLLCHKSGGGGCYLNGVSVSAGNAGPTGWSVWIADGQKVTNGGSLSKRSLSSKQIQRMGFQILPAPLGDPFEDVRECEGGIEWCCICKDYMPDEGECLCRHLFWADDVGITGPGAYDIVNDGAEREFMLPVVEMAVRAGVARTWRSSLLRKENARRQTLSAVGGLGPTFVYARMAGREIGTLVRDAAEEMGEHDLGAAQRAAGWFMALDEKTTKANAATAEWLGLVIHGQDARRRSGAPVYVVRVGNQYETDEKRASPRWNGCDEKDNAYGAWWTTKSRDATRRSWAESLGRALDLRGQRIDARVVFVRAEGKAA